MDQPDTPSSAHSSPAKLDDRAPAPASDAPLADNPAALDIQLEVRRARETSEAGLDLAATPVVLQSSFATQFDPPGVGLVLAQRLPQLVALQLKQCEDPEYVAKADEAHAAMLEELEAGLARIEAETGLKVVILTQPEGNPLTPPGLLRIFFPPSGLNPHLNWHDTSIATLYVLHRAGLTDLLGTGKIDFIDLHACGAHASDPRSSTFPKLDKNGLTKQWSKFGCSNEVNALFEAYNTNVELWRHENTYGITLNLGKTSTAHFAERVRRVDPVPSLAASRKIPVPPRYVTLRDCNPPPVPYRLYTSSLDLDQPVSPAASQQDVASMNFEPARELEPSSAGADTGAARVEKTTYVVVQACHPSYGHYADPDADDVRGDLVVHDTLVSELTRLLSGSTDPPPIAKDYDFYTMRVFNMRQTVAHSTGSSVGLGTFTFPPWVRAALKLLPVEQAAIRAGTHPHGLLPRDLPQGWVEHLVALADSWASYGVESAGRSIKPTTLLERAVAAFKCSLLESRRAQTWGLAAGTNADSPVRELAATSDLRLAAQDGNVGAIAHAHVVGKRLRYSVDAGINADSPVRELAATSDLRLAAQDSNNAASARSQVARDGHRWSVLAGVNAGSPVNELAGTTDLRFAARTGAVAATSAAGAALVEQRFAVPAGTNLRSPVLELAGTTDLRFAARTGAVAAASAAGAALDDQRVGVPAGTNLGSPVLELAASSDMRFAATTGLLGAADKGATSRGEQRCGVDVKVNPGTPVRELAITSDLRAAAVAGTAGAGQAGGSTTAAQRHGTPARTNADTPVHELACTSDLRLGTLTGTAAKYDRPAGYVQPPKQGKKTE